jgi:hypothetical protein
MNEVPDMKPTPASERPTPPDAPVPGASLDPDTTVPDEQGSATESDDPLATIERRKHPFD